MSRQVMGFAWMCVLFAACGAYYHELTQPRLIDVFRLLYYASRYGLRLSNSVPRRQPFRSSLLYVGHEPYGASSCPHASWARSNPKFVCRHN